MEFSLNITNPLTSTVGEIVKCIFQQIGKVFNNPNYSYQEQFNDGNKGRWISCQVDGLITSAYFHQTRQHSATVKSGIKEYRSIAPSGQWAIAVCQHQMLRLSTDKTFYNIL